MHGRTLQSRVCLPSREDDDDDDDVVAGRGDEFHCPLAAMSYVQAAAGGGQLRWCMCRNLFVCIVGTSAWLGWWCSVKHASPVGLDNRCKEEEGC